ncbi:glutaredoxin 2 [Bacteriovoracaceae bacterium]|nr:glutaredoxin 2 [Bacteriovoracaceae bacterium]
MKLYHYVHCPFCIRVRMALGYLRIPYESIVLRYDDETTPVKLAGKKMLPILSSNKKVLNESLDIIELIDQDNRLETKFVTSEKTYLQLETLLNDLGKDIHNLAMPQWIYTKEFNDSSRLYFQKKKEVKRGPFNQLIKKSEKFIGNLKPKLSKLEYELTPYFQSQSFSLRDILIASHLWGLYVVPEFQFSNKIHDYLQNIKKLTNFNYHEDLWKEK